MFMLAHHEAAVASQKHARSPDSFHTRGQKMALQPHTHARAHTHTQARSTATQLMLTNNMKS